MQPNVGSWDRLARIGVGILLIGLAAWGAIGPWGYLGLVPLATGIFRFCPAYAVFGIKTCPHEPGQTR